MRLSIAALLLPLLAHTEELQLQIKAKFLPIVTSPALVEINSAGGVRPVLIGLKPAERANIRTHCLGVERNLTTIKRLLTVAEDDCSVDEANNRIALANKNADYVAVVALLEVPAGAPVRVQWNGKVVYEGPITSSSLLRNGKLQPVELKGLDTLIVQAARMDTESN